MQIFESHILENKDIAVPLYRRFPTSVRRMRVRYIRVTRMRARLTGTQHSKIAHRKTEIQVSSVENHSRVSNQYSSLVESMVFIPRNTGKDE